MKVEEVSESVASIAEKVSDYHSRLMAVERDLKKHLDNCSCHCKTEDKNKENEKSKVWQISFNMNPVPVANLQTT